MHVGGLIACGLGGVIHMAQVNNPSRTQPDNHSSTSNTKKSACPLKCEGSNVLCLLQATQRESVPKAGAFDSARNATRTGV